MVRFSPPVARLVALALNAKLHPDGVPPAAIGVPTAHGSATAALGAVPPDPLAVARAPRAQLGTRLQAAKGEGEGMTKVAYEHLVTDLKDLVRTKNCGPILIRLSWHDAGTFMEGKGGCPNAAMRFTDAGEGTWGANAGLPTDALNLLSDITKKYVPGTISHADLWTLASNVAIRVMGGPDIPTRFGRKDAASSADGIPENEGRLPDGDKGADHLVDVFGPKGFDDRDIVALSGAHTVGMCHLDRSGFDGQWTEDHLKFDNSYFKNILEKKYDDEKTAAGNPQCRHAESDTIMLISDLALKEDPRFRKYVDVYAKDQEAFFKDFTKAWVQLQENGCSGLKDADATFA